MRIRNLDEVRDTLRGLARIEDIFPAYEVPVQSAGTTHYKAVCPWHDDTDPSLSINIEKQLYRCHGCKRGGDVFSLVQEMEHVSFVGAIEKLAEIVGYDLTPHLRELTQQEKEQARLCAQYQSELDALSEPDTGWMERRHLGSEVMEAYGIRFDPKQKRIVVPLRDMSGRVTGFRRRAIDSSAKIKTLAPPDGHPVPLPPLYGLWEARSSIRESGFAIVVEGEVDLWQMWQAGYQNTVAMLGTNFGEQQIQYLLDYGIRTAILMPDGDKAGREFARRFSSTHRKTGLTVKIASLIDGDPDEILLRGEQREMENAIIGARYSFEYLIDQVLSGVVIETITDRVDALSELRDYFSVAAEYERSLAVDEISARLDMDPEAVEDFFRESYDQQKSPLTNIRGERAVIAGMIEDEAFAGEALLSLREDAFYLTKHQRLFQAISLLYTTRDAVNEETISTYLRNKGDSRLADYVESLEATQTEARGYILRDLNDKATRRSVQREARDAVLRLGDTANDSKEIIRSMSASLAHAVAGDTHKLMGMDTIVREQMSVVMERVRAPSLITGLDLGSDWPTLNLALRGLQRKRLFVLAAPTTVGKTAIAGCWAQHAAVHLREPVTYYTFETGEETIFERMVSKMSGVESDKIATGFMDADEIEMVQDSAVDLGASPLVITRAGRGLNEFMAVSRVDHMKRGTRLIVVDYAQLMHVEGWKDRRDLELGFIATSLLELANDLDSTIVLLAQINRAGTKEGGQPKMEHVGDSYRISQDASAFFIARFKSEDEMQMDGIQMGNRHGFLDKNREGRRGVGFSIIADENTSHYREANDSQRQNVVCDRSSGVGQDDSGEADSGEAGRRVPIDRGSGETTRRARRRPSKRS